MGAGSSLEFTSSASQAQYDNRTGIVNLTSTEFIDNDDSVYPVVIVVIILLILGGCLCLRCFYKHVDHQRPRDRVANFGDCHSGTKCSVSLYHLWLRTKPISSLWIPRDNYAF